MNAYLQQCYNGCDYLAALFRYKHRLARILGIGLARVSKFYREINQSGFIEMIAEKSHVYRGFPDLSPLAFFRGPLLYVLCRLTEPQTIVETGVERGFSAAFILSALQKNGKGKLYSIDLPNQPGQELEKGKPTGWIVPEDLRQRWQLILGASQVELPRLLAGLKKIDIFYHDSDHSYANMAFELSQAIAYMSPRGILVADDIQENTAFPDFSKMRNLRRTHIFKTGLIKIEK